MLKMPPVYERTCEKCNKIFHSNDMYATICLDCSLRSMDALRINLKEMEKSRKDLIRRKRIME